MSYEDATAQVRATTIFTTHTPVPAGHDVFPFYLMDKYFSRYYPLLGLKREDFIRLGSNPADPNAGFNMTAFALRMAGYHNGVSKRHGEVAKQMWPSLWLANEKDGKIPEVELWEVHHHLKVKLIDCVRYRTRKRWVEDRIRPTNVITGGTLLEPYALTIGFARRFASYKSADLIFLIKNG